MLQGATILLSPPGGAATSAVPSGSRDERIRSPYPSPRSSAVPSPHMTPVSTPTFSSKARHAARVSPTLPMRQYVTTVMSPVQRPGKSSSPPPVPRTAVSTPADAVAVVVDAAQYALNVVQGPGNVDVLWPWRRVGDRHARDQPVACDEPALRAIEADVSQYSRSRGAVLYRPGDPPRVTSHHAACAVMDVLRPELRAPLLQREYNPSALVLSQALASVFAVMAQLRYPDVCDEVLSRTEGQLDSGRALAAALDAVLASMSYECPATATASDADLLRTEDAAAVIVDGAGPDGDDDDDDDDDANDDAADAVMLQACAQLHASQAAWDAVRSRHQDPEHVAPLVYAAMLDVCADVWNDYRYSVAHMSHTAKPVDALRRVGSFMLCLITASVQTCAPETMSIATFTAAMRRHMHRPIWSSFVLHHFSQRGLLAS